MIYFAQSRLGGPIKIGSSDSPPERVQDLARALAEPIVVLAVMPGGTVYECTLHRIFQHARIDMRRGVGGDTEWFLPTKHIAELVAANGGAIFGKTVPVRYKENPWTSTTWRPFKAAVHLDWLLRRRKTTNTRAAVELAVSTAAISDWRHGKKQPKAHNARRIEEWSIEDDVNGAAPVVRREDWFVICDGGALECLDPYPQQGVS